MTLADGNDENGTLEIIAHNYILSASSLTFFDYVPCVGLTVGHCVNLVLAKGRARYKMTESGNGCRFWV
jgi:hypothetical protein